MVDPIFSVVIRYSGEQTLLTLQNQIYKHVLEADVAIVSSDSFEETLRLSYLKSLEFNRTWSMIIDADILLVERFFTFYLPRALKQNGKNQLGFAFRLWDRFYQSPKFRGLHVYRTAFLKEALTKIPPLRSTLRPESFVKNQFNLQNTPWIKYRNVVGIHDFYQKPQDIFAKMALRAHRSEEDITSLISIFERSGNWHQDFQIALEGLNYGRGINRSEIDNSRITYINAFEEIKMRMKFSVFGSNNIDDSIDKVVFNNLRKRSLWQAIKNYFIVTKMF